MLIGVSVMNAYRQHNHVRAVPETEFPREDFYLDAQDGPVWWYKAHSAWRCDDCEFPYGHERRHPRDPEAPVDLRVLCDGRRVRLVD